MDWLIVVLGLGVGLGSFLGFNYWYSKTGSPLAWRLWCCTYIVTGCWSIANSVAGVFRDGFHWLQLFGFIVGAAIAWIGLYGWQGRKAMDRSRKED